MSVVNLSTVTAKVATETEIDLGVITAEITLDESRAPYCEVILTCAMPDVDDLEQIDPRSNLRVELTAEQSWLAPADRPTQSRTFNVLLHERTIDHERNELRLVCESDEAILIDAGNDTSAATRTYGLSVKEAVTWVLDKYGAELEAGAADANIEPDPNLPEPATNLLSNPSGESNTTGFTNRSNVGSITRTTTQSLFGSHSISFKLSASTVGSMWVSNYLPLAAGTPFTFSFFARSTVSKTLCATVIYFDDSNTQVGSTDGTSGLTSTTDWIRFDVSSSIPPGATKIRPVVYIVAASTSETHYVDGTMLTVGSLIDYFDGSTSDDTDAGFTYEWTGTSNASPSTKTAIPNSDVMIWNPGVSAWDFLAPLVQAAGLRLFCDEQRKWRLVDSDYAVAGQVRISQGINAVSGTDTISRQTDAWFDAVVIEYTKNVDAAGNVFSTFDAASNGGTRLQKRTVERPSPGAGAAALLLSWYTGRGRTLDITALTDLSATPGESLVVDLPATPTQVGVVSSVLWTWSAEGGRTDEMRIGSRGLVDTSETAWLLQPEGYAWADVPAGQSWPEYETPEE